jgi:hypothetical protein
VTIHTRETLRAKHRRIKTRMESAALVLSAMQDGAALYLEFTRRGPRWSLSSGRTVSDDTARLVTSSSSVVACGDCLFGDGLSQVWRWWSEE